jgi:hypothetical protein
VLNYFSVIFYINTIEYISLSSPFSYFSYTFIPLIGSVILSVTSIIYGGYITSFILIEFKDIKKERKKFAGLHIFNKKSYDIDLNMDKCRSEKISGIYSVTEKNDELPPFSVEAEEEIENDAPVENDDHSDEFIFDEPEDDEENKNSSDEKDKENHVPFSFDAPVKKPESFKIGKDQDKVKESQKPFSFDSQVEKPKKPFIHKEEKDFSNDKNKQQITSPFSFDKKNDDVNGTNLDTDINKPKQELTNVNNQINQNENISDLSKPQTPADNDIKKPQNIDEKTNEVTQIDGQIKIDLGRKNISVICPQCKHIFSVVKTGDTVSIKCPMCNKAGIVK